MARTLAWLVAALVLAGCPVDPGVAAPASGASPDALPHAWPPRKGEPFPDLTLLDGGGRTVKLSDLRGRVVLLEPVGMSCPGCQGFSGGDQKGGFGGLTPQRGLSSIDDLLRGAGVDPASPDLVLVQVLFFDLKLATPAVTDAQAWAKHFGWDRRANVVVLVGDDRYRAHPATMAMVPGFFLLDREGVLVVDASLKGGGAPDSLHRDLLPKLAELVGTSTVEPEAVEPVTLCPPEEHPDSGLTRECDAFDAAAERRQFATMDAELTRLHALGRIEGKTLRLADVALSSVSWLGPRDQLARLDAWVQARPRSAWARTARGKLLVSWAWQARGSGYADSVTEEGWRLFRERLLRARQDLEAAVELEGTGARGRAASTLISVAMGLSLGRTVAERWLRVARESDDALEADERMLNFLMPKWHGDEAAMWAFARAAVEAHADDPAWLDLLDVAHQESSRLTPDWKEYQRQRAAELDALQAKIVERYPLRWQGWSRRAAIALLVGDQAAHVAHGLRAAETGDRWWQLHAGERFLQGDEPERYPRDVQRGLRLICRAAASGTPYLQVELARRLEVGVPGLAPDAARALELYEAAADAGNAYALTALARAHVAGRHRPRDLKRAIELYDAAVSAAPQDEAESAAGWRRSADELRARGGPRGRRHADGFDDWYPDDVSPPAGQKYPCALVALPRAQAGIPAADRPFINHLATVCLEATRAKLRFFRGLRWESPAEATLDALRADVTELRALLAAETPPEGLEQVHADVLAALDLELRFFERFAEEMLPLRRRIDGLPRDEASRLWKGANARVFPSIPEGGQASARLRAAWAALERRYGAAWTPAVKDSLYHHLCAMDLS